MLVPARVQVGIPWAGARRGLTPTTEPGCRGPPAESLRLLGSPRRHPQQGVFPGPGGRGVREGHGMALESISIPQLIWNATHQPNWAPRKGEKAIEPSTSSRPPSPPAPLHRKPLGFQRGEPGQERPHGTQPTYPPCPKLGVDGTLGTAGPIPSTSAHHPAPRPGSPPGRSRDAYLAAQLAAGVDAQRPGHMLALG